MPHQTCCILLYEVFLNGLREFTPNDVCTCVHLATSHLSNLDLHVSIHLGDSINVSAIYSLHNHFKQRPFVSTTYDVM